MTNKNLSTGYTQNSSKPNPRASSRSRIQRTKTLLQKNQKMRMRMMKKRKMTMNLKLPENMREATEEATKADTETDKEDTTGDLITKDVMVEDNTTVDAKTIKSVDITDTEARTVTEETMVIMVTEEHAD
jgi:hypothetical protein